MIRRRLGDDSDGSEMDYRDSNSETCSSDGEVERVSGPATWSSLDVSERIQPGETLLFEYFESAAPSHRVPLFDKVCMTICTIFSNLPSRKPKKASAAWSYFFLLCPLTCSEHAHKACLPACFSGAQSLFSSIWEKEICITKMDWIDCTMQL